MQNSGNKKDEGEGPHLHLSFRGVEGASIKVAHYLESEFYQIVFIYGRFCRALSFVIRGELRCLAVETIILS